MKSIISMISLLFFAAGPAAAQSAWAPSKAPTNADLVAVYFTSSKTGWVAGDGGYLAATGDGGRTWVRQAISTTENINEIYFRNDDNGYLVAGTKLFITRDGGRSWVETRIHDPREFGGATPEFLSIRFADKKRGLAIGSLLNAKGDVVDSLVMRTVDGGETWKRVRVPSRLELFHLDFNGSDRAWIVGDQGLILATADSGATWRVQPSGTTAALFNVDFRDDEEGYAVGETGTILRTDNGGSRWEKVKTAWRDTLMRVDFADDKNGWAVGHRGTILRSSDRGRSWVRQESRTTANLYGLFLTKKFGFAVGADGTLVNYLK
ncbi:MAG: YCF48-related protein [Pyrinomonadaceae bacterium]